MNLTGVADPREIAQIIHNDLGGPKDLVVTAVATLSHFEDDLIELAIVSDDVKKARKVLE